MDAAHSLWRPLGTMLVERGLLTVEELEDVLAEQKESGRKLGEIIVGKGLISGPTLAITLAEQWGVELTQDDGFGTGLRNEIQRRHEGERQRRPHLHAVMPSNGDGNEGEPDNPDLLAEIQEREHQLAELSVELAQDDVRLATLESELDQRDARIAKLEQEAQEREAAHAAEVEARARHEIRLAGLFADGFKRLEEVFSERTAELVARPSRQELADLISERISGVEASSAKNAERLELALRDREQRAASALEAHGRRLEKAATQRAEADAKQAKLFGDKIAHLEQSLTAKLAHANGRPEDEVDVAKLLEERFGRLEAAIAANKAELERKLAGAEHRVAKVLTDRPDASADDRSTELAKLLEERFGRLETAIAANKAELERKLAGAEHRVARVLAERPDASAGDPPADLAKLLEERFGQLRAGMAENKTQLERKLGAVEQRFAHLLAERPDAPITDRSEADADLAKLLEERFGRLEASMAQTKTELERKLAGSEHRVANVLAERRDASATDRSESDAELAKLLSERFGRLEAAIAENKTELERKLAGAERRFAQVLAERRDTAASERGGLAEELARLESSVERTEKELAETLAAAKDELLSSFAERASAGEETALRQLRSRFDEVSAKLNAAVGRVDSLEAVVQKTATDILDRLESQTTSEPEAGDETGAEAEPADHLLFMPSESGYSLVSVALPPPAVGATLDLDGQRLLVTKVGSSPFPRDERPCAYVQRIDQPVNLPTP